MTVDEMRNYVCKMYTDSPRWRLKVNGMPDRQVIAIYKTMQKRGQQPKKKPKENNTQQLSIFDFLGGKQNA